MRKVAEDEEREENDRGERKDERMESTSVKERGRHAERKAAEDARGAIEAMKRGKRGCQGGAGGALWGQLPPGRRGRPTLARDERRARGTTGTDDRAPSDAVVSGGSDFSRRAAKGEVAVPSEAHRKKKKCSRRVVELGRRRPNRCGLRNRACVAPRSGGLQASSHPEHRPGVSC